MKHVWRLALILTGLLAAIALGGAGAASAHRDGCHAQHSCPSDTGSYVCGDTGNYSECPGMAGTVAVSSADPKVGSALTGSVSWSAAPKSVVYQWTRGGQPIPGATTITYVISTDDLGQTLLLSASGTDGRGQVASANSAPVAVAPLAGQVSLAQGGATVGTTLSAKTAWNASVSESFQWRRGGAAIPGANTATHLVTKDDVGKEISLTVLGAAGSSAAVAQSNNLMPTAAVKLRLTGPLPTVKAGRTAAIRGVVTSVAPVAGLRVKIQVSRLVRGLWRPVLTRTVTVATTGTFSVNQRIPRSQAGAWRARADFAASGGYLAARTIRSFKAR